MTDPDCAGAAGGPLDELNGSFSTNDIRTGAAAKLLRFGEAAEPAATLAVGHAFERHLAPARPSSNLTPGLAARCDVNRHKVFTRWIPRIHPGFVHSFDTIRRGSAPPVSGG